MISALSSWRKLFLAGLLFTGLTFPALAVTVTNTMDNVDAPPAGSLRKAIADAVDGDTIAFDPSVTGTITLAGAELLLDKNLTITGPGSAVLAVSGNQQSRVFRVPAGKTVSISGLTIRDGKAPDAADGPVGIGASGGGILNEGLLAVTNSWLTNNEAGQGSDWSGVGAGDGGAGGSGGAISNAGNLTLDLCRLSGNRAGAGGLASQGSGGFGGNGGNGGAIHSSSGELKLLRCTFEENKSGQGGYSLLYDFVQGSANGGDGGNGGSVSIVGGTGSLERCTVANSQCGRGGYTDSGVNTGDGGAGGGVFIGEAAVTILMCTISGNEAGAASGVWGRSYTLPPGSGGSGGGLACVGGGANLIGCTVSNNFAGEDLYIETTFGSPTPGKGGGIHVGSGTMTLRSTIVAGNGLVPAGVARDVSGTFVSEGHNLIGCSDGSSGFVAGGNGDIVGTEATPVDPLLTPLGDYGGPTPTHVPLKDGPAFDAGDDSITGTDQRGEPRLIGVHVDIGSVEGNLQVAVLSFTAQEGEAEEASGSTTIVVRRISDTSSAVTVQYSTIDGTAMAGTDYSSTSGVLNFAAGQTEATITVPIATDTVLEQPKTFLVRLDQPSANAIIYPHNTQTITIFDDDGPGILTFATSSSTKSEDGGTAPVTIVRKNGSVGTVSVSFAMATGSAGSDDYVSFGGTLTFDPGVTQQTIGIPIVNDSGYESDETFSVNLSSPSGGAALGAVTTHVVTILNDDPPPPPPLLYFEVVASAVSEGAGIAVVNVRRSQNVSQSVSVSYQTSAGTAVAGVDFSSSSGTITFPSFSENQTITVPILHDETEEGLETFILNLSNPTGGAVLGANTSHTVTILDNDGPATIEFSKTSSSVPEASGQAVITLIRFGNATASTTVQVSATNGTAISGSDYSFETSTVTFGAGVLEQTVTLVLVDDGVEEGDEQMELVLSNPGGGATLGSQTTHTITILNDAEDVPEVSKGSYHGLVANTDAEIPEYGGIAIKTTAKGQLTGSLKIRGKTLRIRGSFSESGTFYQGFPQAALGTLAGSSLQLYVGSGGLLTGTFEVSDGTAFQVDAKRDVSGTRTNPVAEANAYTALLQTQLDGNPAGFLRVRVQGSGGIALSGMLPDGTRLSGATHLAEDGSFPIFFPAHARKLGWLAGTAEIAVGDPLPLTGELHWEKPADSKPPYGDGLVDEPIELAGAVYTPVRRQRILDDFDSTQGAALLNVEEDSPLEIPFTWNQDNTIRVTPPNSTSARMVLKPRTGLLSGSFRETGGRLRKFYGICLQQAEAGADQAAGFCLGDEASSRIDLLLPIAGAGEP